MTTETDISLPEEDAALAAALLAVDPVGLGGAVLHSQPSPPRDGWLGALRGFLPAASPLRRVPLHISDDRLMGGLDLAATLSANRPVFQRGLLSECEGGVALLAMAERLSTATAARIASVIDGAPAGFHREGQPRTSPAQIAIVALDEGVDDERVPTCLTDRLALHVDLRAVDPALLRAALADLAAADITAGQTRLATVAIGADTIDALCNASLAFGIMSLRAPLFATRVARAHAALRGKATVDESDTIVAARLVLAPRATVVPATPPANDHADGNHPNEHGEEPRSQSEQRTETPKYGPLTEMVVQATRATLPPAILAALTSGGARQQRKSSGRAGALQRSAKGGRAVGSRRGSLRGSARLDVVETLKAAAPWQRIRRNSAMSHDKRPILIQPDDLRVVRFKQRSETATIFVVDASGSTAARRLGEAKGAVELLLAECYVRRDRVSLLTFGGRGVDVALPPTRSLSRSKRCLAELSGGGGTPLASAIVAASHLADAVRRKGQTPLVVLLTDGSANITRDGTGDRVRAQIEALDAARLVRDAQFAALLIDTSPQPRTMAKELAKAMQAKYLPLPQADARTLAGAIQAAQE